MLRTALAQIAARNPALANQLQRAAASVPLNLAEAQSRRGKDPTERCRIAAGSAREVRAGLQVGCALAQLDDAVAAPATGPLAQAHLVRSARGRAGAGGHAGPGGSSGTLQAVRDGSLAVVAGRYPLAAGDLDADKREKVHARN